MIVTNRMRIGHQIYSYLYDYTDTGDWELKKPINFMVCGRIISLRGAYINFEENQVYLVFLYDGNLMNTSIHDYLCLLRDLNYEPRYKTLYFFRNCLSILRKEWKVKYKQQIKQLRNIDYERKENFYIE